MAQQLRLVGASIDTYGSRRAWKRHRRVARRQQSAGTAGGPPGVSLATLAAASVAILGLCTLAALVLGQIVFAAV